jgi:hypothetical protein
MEADYPYKGIPITPAIVEYLIKSYLRGQQLRRSQIIDSVVQKHIEHGGLPAEATDLWATVKKALTNLKQAGLARNPSTGWWSIEASENAEDLSPGVPADAVAPERADQEIRDYTIECVRGIGDEAVYVLYYPAYKNAALAAGNDRWLCKIGRTDRPPNIRVSEEAAGMPEKPVIGLLFKTEESRILESVLHGVLTLRGQWSEESPGTEWFLTSPDDVLRVIKLAVPKPDTEQSPGV